jgi:hypothetical protein
VLPSWRDRVCFALTPDALSWVRVARGFRPAVVEKNTVPCTAEPNGASWQDALPILQRVLATQAAADATVVLSNHFVRYVLVPWSDALNGADEELAFARHCFAKVYGDAAADWEVRLSDGKPGVPRVASAVDRQLVEALRSAFAQSKLALRSVQPLLMISFNRWRGEFRRRDAWFIIAERGRYCCAAIEKQEWRNVRSGKLGDGFLQELPQLFKRELSLAGSGDTTQVVMLHAPEEPRFASVPGSGWQVMPLVLPPCNGFSPFSDPQYAMAMSAVS